MLARQSVATPKLRAARPSACFLSPTPVLPRTFRRASAMPCPDRVRRAGCMGPSLRGCAQAAADLPTEQRLSPSSVISSRSIARNFPKSAPPMRAIRPRWRNFGATLAATPMRHRIATYATLAPFGRRCGSSALEVALRLPPPICQVPGYGTSRLYPTLPYPTLPYRGFSP